MSEVTKEVEQSADVPTTEHHDAMLAAGWIAVRDLNGDVVEWQDPTEPRNVWREWDAWHYWSVGDCNNVPRVKRPMEAT